jgi:DNA-binding XRE family transcriptional regulator
MNSHQFKQARRKLGLTQGQLGEILDTAPQTIRKWEMDETRSTARSVNPIAARVMQWMLDGYRPPEWPR